MRAVFDEKLLNLACQIGHALGTIHNDIAIARDTRSSGAAMTQAVCAGLKSSGAAYRYYGVAPTPTLAYLTRRHQAGLMITASHNPPEYNGLKLWNPDGSSYDAAQQEMITALLANTPAYPEMEPTQPPQADTEACEAHLERIRGELQGGSYGRVVVDAGGGAAAHVTPALLEGLGAEVIRLNCAPTGDFPRPSEPTAENLAELSRRTVTAGASAGLAHDGDADRLMAVDERGRFIPGDKLLLIFARSLGAKSVVTTVDASMIIEESGLDVRRVPVGDTAVSAALRDWGEFGGEPSGSWVFPSLSLCPDGIYAAALLTRIANSQKLSEMVDSLPDYPLLRSKVPADGIIMDDIEKALKALEPGEIDYTDGLKAVFEDGWLLIRPSGTEPLVRITAQGRNRARAEALQKAGLECLRAAGVTGGVAA